MVLTACVTGLCIAQQPAATVLAAYGEEVGLLERPAKLNVDDVTLGHALAELQRRSGVSLVFSPSRLPNKARVSCSCDAITVAQALDELLQRTRMRYSEIGVHVLIEPTDADISNPATQVRYASSGSSAGNGWHLIRRVSGRVGVTFKQDAVITGVVVNRETREPVAGAQVVVDGTGRGAITDAEGRFRISNVPAGRRVVSVTSIGYRRVSQEVDVADGATVTVDLVVEETAIPLEEMVVTGSMIEARLRESPSPVSVVTSEEIARRKIVNVDELFRGAVPGVASYSLGPDSWSSIIFVRGRSSMLLSNGPKVYIDGVEMVSSGFLPSLDPASIERIEVARGPQASTLYGANALAGVIQIFTKKGMFDTPRPQLNVKAEATTVESPVMDEAARGYNVSASMAGGGEEFSYNLGLSNLYTGEYVQNYNQDRSSFYAGFGGRVGDVRGDFSMRFFRHRITPALSPLFAHLAANGAPATLGIPNDRDYFNRTGTFSSNLSYSPGQNWRFNFLLGYDRLQQQFVTNSPKLSTPDDTLLFYFNYEGQKVNGMFTGAAGWALGAATRADIVFGAEYTSLNWQNVGVSGPDNRGSLGPSQYTTRDFTGNSGYFVQGRLNLRDRVYLTSGVRIEDNPSFGEDYGFNGMAVAPRVGVAYVTELGALTSKARVSYGKAIRPPDHGAKAGGNFGFEIRLPNSRIGPEVQVGADLGLDMYYGDLASLEVSYYDQNADDLIDIVYLDHTADPRISQYQNVGKIHNRGWEFAGKLRPGPFELSGTFSVMNSTVKTLSPDYEGEYLPGDALTSVPKYSGGVTLQYSWNRLWSALEMTAMGGHVDLDYFGLYEGLYGLQPYTGNYRDYWVDYPGFAKFNLNLGYDVTRALHASALVSNLTNSDAIEMSNLFVSPGRAVTLGLTWKP